MNLLLFLIVSFNMRISVDLKSKDLNITGFGNENVIEIKGAVPLMEYGEPMLPIKPVFVSIPQNYYIKDVRVIRADSILLNVNWSSIKRVELEDYRVDDARSLAQRYFSRIIEPLNTWTSFGYRIGVLNFYPIRHNQATGETFQVTHVELELELSETSEPVETPRIMRKMDFDYIKRILRAMVVNPDDVERFAPPVTLLRTVEPTSNLYPYVIITQDGLEDYFDELTAIFAMEGYPAIVKTISWIESHYSGSDRLEKVRNFIRDMYLHHGTVWVLLGADSPFLPSRVVNIPIGTGYYDDVPTDLYFSCLDGTWDRNGNGRYAELEDSVDLMPDVFVGRVTFQDSSEIANVVRKYLAYVSPADTSYSTRTMFVGADLFSSGDGAALCEELTGYVPTNFEIVRMYESESHDNTVSEFIDNIRQGISLVTMDVHGWYTFVNLNSTPRRMFTYNHADTLPNIDKPTVFNIVSCETGGFDRECIVEHMMRAPGGAIAVLSSTRNNYPYVVQPYNIYFFSHLYQQNIREIAALDLMARSVFLPYAGALNHSRYALFSYNLMGMPQLRLWNTVPSRPHFTNAPTSIATGLQTISCNLVDGNGNPLSHKMVAVYKTGETYAVDTTDADGHVQFTVNPQTAGRLYIASFDPTITAVIETVVVTSGMGTPYIHSYAISYPENRVSAGDSADISITVGNDGLVTFTDVVMRFSDADTAIDLLVDSIVIDTVFRRDTVVVPSPLRIRVHNRVIDGYVASIPVQFIVNGNAVSVDTVGVTISAPALTLLRKRIEHHVGSNIYKLWPFVSNYGNGEARGVSVQLLPSPDIGIIDTSSKIGRIGPHSQAAPPEPLKFIIYSPSPDVVLKLRLNADNTVRYQDFELSFSEISVPQNVDVSNTMAGIKISWSPVSDSSLRGYLVYRSENGSNFELLTQTPVEHPEFVDMDVSYGIDYRYFVTAIDEYGTESVPSDTVDAFRYEELDGWPVVVMGPSAPLIADIDPYPGKEVILGSENGKLYAFHADGTPLDGWPIDIGGTIITSPAAGDLDGDGYDEVVAIPGTGSRQIFVFKGDGTQLNGWPKTICGQSWAAPTLYDLDGDGHLEVIVHANCGKLYAFRWNGEPYLDDTTGLFYDLTESGSGFSEVAVADINNDGLPEVITGDSRAGISALTYYGQMIPEFPVSGTESMTEIAVADFVPSEPGLEIVTFVGRNRIYMVTSNGRVANGWPVDIGDSLANFYNFSMHAIAADIDNDGVPEVVTNSDDGILAFNGDGTPVTGFPYMFGEHMYTEQSPIATDVDGDGAIEAFMLAYYKAYGVASDGTDYGSFPIDIISGSHKTAAIDDVDGDGAAEMVIPASDGFIHVIKMPGTWSFNGWPQYQHDKQKTGNYNFTPGIFGSCNEGREPSHPLLNGVLHSINHGGVVFRASVPVGTSVSVEIYSVDGRLVSHMAEIAGSPNVVLKWNPSNAHSGVYFYRMSAGGKTKMGKFIVIK